MMILPDRLLIRSDLLTDGGLDDLNTTLENSKAGKLRPTAARKTRLTSVKLLGGDRDAALAVLRRAAGDEVSFLADVRYSSGTDDDPSAREQYTLLGEKTGHGVASWVAVGQPDPALTGEVAADGPVVAVLDSGVYPHPSLPKDGFVLEATGWDLYRPLDIEALPKVDGRPAPGSHAGHGTFIAGIIRRHAPTARVLSVRVMNDLGQVNEENVISALEWLDEYRRDGGRVDVVLMAFGRKVENGDDATESAQRLKKAIDVLATGGVQVVISAGNGNGSRDPVFPANYAQEAGERVRSVGGGESKARPDYYSSQGDWVQNWSTGLEVVSLMPPELWDLNGGHTGFAQWSGTSFSAALQAAERAAENLLE